MTFRQFILVTHRWTGLASSAVLAIAGATGAVLVFRADSWAGTAWLDMIGKLSSRLHEHLMLGRAGYWAVVVATAASIYLEIGGLVLWWRRKLLKVHFRGWWRVCFDLHHVIGIVLAPVMLIIAVTGVAMAFVWAPDHPELWRTLTAWHMGRFGFAVKVVYAVASFAFLIQGLTGLVVWWARRPDNGVAK
jgi:uncharacterized iron-regulated membrane protein